MTILINKKYNNEEICIGDLYNYSFKKLEGTAFQNSNLSDFIKKEMIDNMYIHIHKSEDTPLNVVGYSVYYVKNEQIQKKDILTEPIFFNYLFSKDILTKVNNIIQPILKIEDLNVSPVEVFPLVTHNIKEEKLGLKTNNNKNVDYDDIIQLNLETLKNINFIPNNFLEEKKITAIYCHIKNASDHSHFFTTPILIIYTLSENGFENGDSKEDNIAMMECYNRTKNMEDYPYKHIHKIYNGVPILNNLIKNNAIDRIIKNSQKSEKDIELEDFIKEEKKFKVSL